jgi:hypothetical protein
MKKKVLMGLIFLAIIVTGAFAQGFSLAAGGGALFDYNVGDFLKDSTGRKGEFKNLSFGGFGFFDATYVELDVNFAYGLFDANYNFSYSLSATNNSALQLGFTLLGKYPISLGGFALFPLLGADYNRVLSYMQENKYLYAKPGGDSQFGLLAGAGLDFPFSNALFLRAEALFHLRFPSKNVNDGAKLIPGASTGLGFGPRIKIGVGYRLGGSSGSKSSSSSTRSQSGRYMLVNADALNVRSKPSADSALVGTLPRNTRVEVLDRSGTWWKIKSGKIQGYVNSSYLKAE